MKRHITGSRILSALFSFGILSAMATASSSSAASDETDGGLPVIAESNASESGGFGDSTLTVNDTSRSAESNYVTITWTISIEGETPYETQMEARGGTYRYYDRSVFRVVAEDPNTETTYHPLQDASGFCLCTGNYYPEGAMNEVNDGESATYWNSYRLPEDVSEITLRVPGFEPVTGIKVG